MAELTMPKMGDAMEEGTVLRWLKREGDPIAEEEAIAEIQTEKATIEVPSVRVGQTRQDPCARRPDSAGRHTDRAV